MMIPAGTTHFAEFYGEYLYYKCTPYQHLNQVMEAWQTRYNWKWWDLGKWTDVGVGFSTRRVKDINDLLQVQPDDAPSLVAGHAV